MSEALKLVEEVIFDPETGEILEGVADRPDMLPKFARAIRAIRGRVQLIISYRNDELKRIDEHCRYKLQAFYIQEQKLLQLCQQQMEVNNDEKVEYPGLGAFRFGTSRESVNDETYYELSDNEKACLQDDFPQYFNTKTTVSPNKKTIMVDLKDGINVAGFKVNEKEKVFKFKEE